MRRWILTIASPGVVALWLLFAYVPSLPRPMLGWPLWSGPAMALSAAAVLAVFLLIQVYMVRATDCLLSGGVPAEQLVIQAEFNLHKGREIFWTALPIVMTLFLVAVAWPLWQSLFSARG